MIAGNTTTEISRQLPTPTDDTTPILFRPRCGAMIMLPNPTMFVSDVRISELIMLGDDT